MEKLLDGIECQELLDAGASKSKSHTYVDLGFL